MDSVQTPLNRGQAHRAGRAATSPSKVAAEPSAGRAGRSKTAALWLTWLLLGLVSLLGGALLWQTYAAAVNEAEARARGAAQVASAHVRWLAEASLQALQRIDAALGSVLDSGVEGGTARSDLNAAVAGLPLDTYAWVFDALGKPLLSNDPQPLSFQAGQLMLFEELRAGARWRISPLLTTRADGARGFLIGRRLERGGQFAGMALVVVPAELMASFWQALELGKYSSVGLVRDDGWLVARFPVPEAALNLSAYRLFTTDLPRSPTGLYHAEASPADGVARIVAYRRVEGLPLVAVAGVSKDAVLTQFWNRAGWMLAVALPIAGALVLMARRVGRLLGEDERLRRELAAAVAQNRTLFNEMHHRVKNNLQVVSAMVNLWPGAADAKQETLRRIAAMGVLHQQVYESNQLDRVDLRAYLERLTQALRDIYGEVATVAVSGAGLAVRPALAQPLGLIAGEALSNAFKHAFAPGQRGSVELHVDQPAVGTGRLLISDDGRGRATANGSDPAAGVGGSANGSGIGARLVEGLAAQIGASVTYLDGPGTTVEIRFPLGES